MAARTNKIRHDDETRAKIQAAHLINRFQACFNGELELTREQISCGKLLLDKALPDLQSVDYTGDVTVPFVVRAPEQSASAESWEQKNAPPTIQ